jgi:hypothetical protein
VAREAHLRRVCEELLTDDSLFNDCGKPLAKAAPKTTSTKPAKPASQAKPAKPSVRVETATTFKQLKVGRMERPERLHVLDTSGDQRGLRVPRAVDSSVTVAPHAMPRSAQDAELVHGAADAATVLRRRLILPGRCLLGPRSELLGDSQW